jgi:gluconolactonase
MDVDMAAPGLERIIGTNPVLDRIAHGLTFGEGPVWDRRSKQFFWVDIVGNTIWKWNPGVGREIVLRPSGQANGMTFDQQGRLLVAGWASRKVWRFEPDGSMVTIASHYQGKKLNSPNDIVVRSDGSIYWTDSPGALTIPFYVPEDTQRYLDVQGVYRLSPENGEVTLVIDDFVYPNGLAFSPDESLLYVDDTRLGIIRVFDVRPDGSVGPGRLFHKPAGLEPGVPDGMKVDVEGNLYCTGPGGVHIIDPSGKLLGRIKLPGHHCTNLAWGDDDWRSLYFTTFDSVYRTRLNIPGVAVW